MLQGSLGPVNRLTFPPWLRRSVARGIGVTQVHIQRSSGGHVHLPPSPPVFQSRSSSWSGRPATPFPSIPAVVCSHGTRLKSLSGKVPLPGWCPKAHCVASIFSFLFPPIGARRDLQPGFSQGQSQRDSKETIWKLPGPSLTQDDKVSCQPRMLTVGRGLG